MKIRAVQTSNIPWWYSYDTQVCQCNNAIRIGMYCTEYWHVLFTAKYALHIDMIVTLHINMVVALHINMILHCILIWLFLSCKRMHRDIFHICICVIPFHCFDVRINIIIIHSSKVCISMHKSVSATTAFVKGTLPLWSCLSNANSGTTFAGIDTSLLKSPANTWCVSATPPPPPPTPPYPPPYPPISQLVVNMHNNHSFIYIFRNELFIDTLI